MARPSNQLEGGGFVQALTFGVTSGPEKGPCFSSAVEEKDFSFKDVNDRLLYVIGDGERKWPRSQDARVGETSAGVSTSIW